MKIIIKLATAAATLAILACGISDGPSLLATTKTVQVSTIAGSTPATGFMQAGLVVDSLGNIFSGATLNGIVKYTWPLFTQSAFENTLVTNPRGIAIDGSDTIYGVNSDDGTIFQLTSAGVVTLFAGIAGAPGESDGALLAAGFYAPSGIAIDGFGNIFVSDTGGTGTNHLRMMAGGNVTTIAAIPDLMFGLAADIAGNVYGVSMSDNKLYKFSPPSYAPQVLAGSGVAATIDGIGATAAFNGPQGVTVDRLGTIYVSESTGNVIRKVTATGIVTTYAGNGVAATVDGTPSAASFNSPADLAITAGGVLFIQESGPFGGNILRRVN